MPIGKGAEGRWTAFCVNGCEKVAVNAKHLIDGTTMRRDTSVYVLFEGVLVDGRVETKSPGMGRIVKVVTCRACGAIELYHATVNQG